PRVRDEARGKPRAAAPRRGLPALRAPRVPARGQGVPDHRGGLHGGPAPLGRPRRGAAPVRRGAGALADPRPPGHRSRVSAAIGVRRTGGTSPTPGRARRSLPPTPAAPP